MELRNSLSISLHDKDEFGMIDIFRVIFAIGIVAIHISPLSSINATADYWVQNILMRVGVPFFS